MFDELWSRYPHTTLTACGRAVGLPEGQMGNSEVGHLNLGAGAVVRAGPHADRRGGRGRRAGRQRGPARGVHRRGERVHLIGLVSDGGVHSGFGHLEALIELAAELGVPDLVLHAFTDGRDTLPHVWRGLPGDRRRVDARRRRGAHRLGGGPLLRDGPRLAAGSGSKRAYDLLVHGRAEHRAARGARPPRDAYERGETDEFITPALVGEEAPDPAAATRSSPSISVPTACARSRARWPSPASPRSTAGARAPVERYATMTEYEEGWPYPVAFPPERPATTLPRDLAATGLASSTWPRPRSTRT